MRAHILTPAPIAAVPPLTPTLAWYDPSDLSSLTVSGGLCSQMNDKTGTANHQKATSTARPTSGVDTINGLNVLKFDGVANTMKNTATAYTEPMTMFIVVKLSTLGAVQRDLLVVTATNVGGLYVRNTPLWAGYNGAFFNPAITPNTSAHVIAATFNSTSSVSYVDASGSAPGGSVAGLTGGTNVITYGDSTVVGDLGEALLYSSVLSAGDLGAQFAYLKAKWGTP